MWRAMTVAGTPATNRPRAGSFPRVGEGPGLHGRRGLPFLHDRVRLPKRDVPVSVTLAPIQ